MPIIDNVAARRVFAESELNEEAGNTAKGSRRVLLWRQEPRTRSDDSGHLCVFAMSESVQSCPSCRTLLLTDTVQCPLCQHVVNPEVVGEIVEELTVDTISAEREGVECGDCGEVVRPELVRCWRCGAFLRPEIAARFQEMQRNPSPVMYSQEGGSGELEDTALGSLQQSSALTGAVLDEGGFELAEGVSMSEGADFELDDELQATDGRGEDSESGEGVDEQAEGEAESGESGEVSGDSSADGEADSEGADDDTSHPVAASGDALLDIAMREEEESDTRRKKGASSVTRGGARATAKTGFIVFCPNGHPIEVQERHRGKSGRCPKCQSPFHVPQQNWDPGQGEDESSGESEEQQVELLYVEWFDDVRMHQVDPGSLKLKVDSLAAKFETVDLGFSVDNLLLVKLAKGGGLFGGAAAKKLPEIREQVREHLEDVRSTDGLPASEFVVLPGEVCETLRVVQPAPYAHESMFAGIDVFGVGRIAVRLPDDSESKTIDFLSFSLSEFRRLSGRLEELFGISAFGADVGVPLKDTLNKVTCHYNEETTMTVVENVAYYEADETFEVTRVGCRCEGCGLIVSEDARKKEKIGGKSGKGIAKAVCPKCKRRFGDNPLFEISRTGADDQGLESVATEATEATEEADPEAVESEPGESAGEPSGDEMAETSDPESDTDADRDSAEIDE